MVVYFHSRIFGVSHKNTQRSSNMPFCALATRYSSHMLIDHLVGNDNNITPRRPDFQGPSQVTNSDGVEHEAQVNNRCNQEIHDHLPDKQKRLLTRYHCTREHGHMPHVFLEQPALLQ